ncbi:MAG: ATP-dependent DNA helicase RecG [Chloroflexota bacterium]|nr:ATP-dependent DNA helicase RecG [Chloroflexota bacterium]MDP6756969.1 ATP-dependent DNA helicase RecG [Chloroflexota bacterium]
MKPPSRTPKSTSYPEARRITITSSPSSKPGARRLQALAGILELERTGDFSDRAVSGGLAGFVANLQADLLPDLLVPEVARLLHYPNIDPSDRAEAIGDALEALGVAPAALKAPAKKRAAGKAKSGKAARKSARTKTHGTGKICSKLDTPVTNLFRVGPQYEKLLKKLNIATYEDFLYHFPRKYLDRSNFTPVSDIRPGQAVNIIADVTEISTRRARRMNLTRGVLSDESDSIAAVWFNQPYLQKTLQGRRNVAFFGRARWGRDGPELSAPDFELDLNRSLHAGRQVPVYPATGKLTQKILRLWAREVVDACAGLVVDFLPAEVIAAAGLIPTDRALHDIHFPESPEAAAAAVKRLAFDELFLLQLGVLERRRDWREGSPGRAIEQNREPVRQFVRDLPFKLTGNQSDAIGDILDDIERPVAMNRLLQGDVGSGKTVVAAAAILACVRAGHQAAIMAPTQLLAEQHLATLNQVFQGEEIVVELITGALTKAKRRKAWARVAAGEVDVVVGTQALITDEAEFDSLTFIVIDEQHRFGVHQRARIRGLGINPHVLVMTATPIPRTLALTIYGDLDISRIAEMPPGRLPVKTALIAPEQRAKSFAFIREQVAEGRQVFVVFPLIEESETLQVRSAEAEFERLRSDVFPQLAERIGLLHGRLTNKAKTAVMNAFRDHELDILVTTAVVEVGVDVPNATIMMVEGAERFGLAQLHQFRGRVGRSDLQSYCLLLSDSEDAADNQRLLAMTRTNDGFQLAERDLELRGPGEVLGSRQSGLPELRVASLSDVATLELSRREAIALFKRDPDLREGDNRLVRERLDSFWDRRTEVS